ncbi:MAG: tetratricopeptide repeat protein [Methylococcales bacterium]
MKIAELKKIVISQPENIEAHQDLVACYLEDGNRHEAIQCLQEIIKRWPSYINAYSMLGSLYLKQADWPNAGNMFMHITRLSPDRVRAWVSLAFIFDKLNNYEEAIKCCQKALLLKADSEKAHNILAFSLLKSGRHEKAKLAMEKLISLFPDSVEAKYILAAFSKDKQPEKSPEDYIKGVFDNYADNFENNLINTLKYNVPELLNNSLRKSLPEESPKLRIVDLGCGTGLMGEKLKDVSSHMTGVDLSEKMLARAEEKRIYDSLINEDVLKAISEDNDNYDLIVATDVFIYIGDLSAMFEKIYKSMRKGGLFGFSIELTDCRSGYLLQHTGRYAQSIEYINELAMKNQFIICLSEKIVVRLEQEKPIEGYIFILKK